jgi:hypothetical protein
MLQSPVDESVNKNQTNPGTLGTLRDDDYSDITTTTLLFTCNSKERLITKLFDEYIIDKLLKIHIETFGGRYREINGEYVEPTQLQVVCQRLWNVASWRSHIRLKMRMDVLAFIT